ncbi:sigma factor [Amycolatopsis sp. KNN50.9b]|uniref:sigma factor n=1 Tax=Amycolatopsis sp. KNN50.9b TaxID=2018303 RepID=UPI001E5112EC|nr:sigma factor [Amycolatopsis sp. KNN50.9b]
MNRAEAFEELRPSLFSIAYRLLGSVSDAEDAVQDAWLRFAASSTRPDSLNAFPSATVSRIAIDVLRSARVRREEYVGPWFPEPLLADPYQDPQRSAEPADSLSMAALLLLERLSPLERAVFVLREVFGCGFPEIASAVGRSEAAWRHVDAVRPRFEAGRAKREELAGRFLDAFRSGDVGALTKLLAADVQLVGGKAPQWASRFTAPGRWPGCSPSSCRRPPGSAARCRSMRRADHTSAIGARCVSFSGFFTVRIVWISPSTMSDVQTLMSPPSRARKIAPGWPFTGSASGTGAPRR